MIQYAAKFLHGPHDGDFQIWTVKEARAPLVIVYRAHIIEDGPKKRQEWHQYVLCGRVGTTDTPNPQPLYQYMWKGYDHEYTRRRELGYAV